ncbi:hypothetical protein J5N97_015957 [Dioscorea zingiberensis]|uniref:25S rRNA (uridine-N(3))-methyltransferase BMT5-like domain-containing protein n=1 Tax=Dioscorea zingiberensis TaxID=325984 RepID=A0A9D5CK18_9LILI|nr:hypothetical protein J5N97_015957 [Dioscorea zingiberensis]
MLSEEGQVHVAHRNDFPYRRWNLEKLAKKAGLVLVEMVEFIQAAYPGYHNKRGDGFWSDETFPLTESFTFKFSLPESSQDDDGKKMTLQFNEDPTNKNAGDDD